MDIIVRLIHREPGEQGALIGAIRRLAPYDASVVECGEEPGVVSLRITSRWNLDDASVRAIELVALAGVDAGTTFSVTTGELNWPPETRDASAGPDRQYLYG